MRKLIAPRAMLRTMAIPTPRVHKGQRFFETPDGKPFFWLADTAWELFHRLNREEADHYLQVRARQGFNVVQAVLLAELDGLNTPNAYGHRPLLERDPTRPDPAGYWEHVDWIVDRAATYGIYMALLPTWGDKVSKAWGSGPVVFDESNAYIYGSWVGKRYGDRPNVLWVMGGDRDPRDTKAVWRAMAKGVRDHEDGRRLMTFHPQGGQTSGKDFHTDEWLDFNMMQSGHADYAQPADLMLEGEWNRTPAKPALDGEPNYENHRPFKDNMTHPYMRDFDVRRASYWSVFAGGAGVTYGCHAVWQMFDHGRQPINQPLGTWRQSLDLPGARQLAHLAKLLTSRPYFERVPDQGLILQGALDRDFKARATRDAQDRYALIYLPGPRPVKLDLARFGSAPEIRWFDPRTGEYQPARKEDGFFHAPTAEDWVLCLDREAVA